MLDFCVVVWWVKTLEEGINVFCKWSIKTFPREPLWNSIECVSTNLQILPSIDSLELGLFESS